MANCHAAFLEYLTELNLTDTQQDKLRTSRDALLARIASKFKEAGRTVPADESQGSYILDTQNHPLSDDFDLDHGIYLKHGDDKTDLSVTEAYRQIEEAVDGHTSLPLGRKDTCVRVHYKKAADDTPAHHIDLAIYRLFTSGTRKYAHRVKGWLDTDQKGFIAHFQKRCAGTAQIRPVVRVAKGWADFNGGKPGSVKFPSGFHLTACALECMTAAADRHDRAFVDTSEKILGRLRAYAARTGAPFKRPVAPYEDIFGDYDQARLSAIIAQFEHLVREGRRALAEPDLARAQRIWLELLGDRFPAPPAVTVENPDRKWSVPAVLGRSDKAG